MFVSRLCLASLLTGALWVGAAGAADHIEAYRQKTCTPDGVCVPNRQAYGFYPTQWRKWPGAELATLDKKPTKQPEPLPPPRKAPSRDTRPSGDLPGDALNDDMPLPGDDSDTMPAPPGDSGPLDTEPRLPGDVQPKLPQQPSDQEDLRNFLPDDDEPSTATPKKPAETIPEDDTPPAMPEDEDPFKDEEIPGDPNNGSSRQPRLLGPTNQTAGNIRWRTAPSLAAKAAATKPTMGQNESPEPRLLQSATAGKSATRKAPAATAANPLRSASAVAKPKVRKTQSVTPTAEWSASADEPATASLWHSNPLRSR